MPKTEDFLFTERLYKQLQTVEEFRFKFSTMKIIFVSGLLGIGWKGITSDFSAALLLAPLVAVLFDILGMAATLAIYRIDAFLRINGLPEEKRWQDFPKAKPFYRYAADSFTVITFLASAFGLCLHPSTLILQISSWWLVIIWFVIVAGFWVFFRRSEKNHKNSYLSMGTTAPKFGVKS